MSQSLVDGQLKKKQPSNLSIVVIKKKKSLRFHNKETYLIDFKTISFPIFFTDLFIVTRIYNSYNDMRVGSQGGVLG